MAALVAGVQYGLSSHSNFHENKSLIFVKLTDSAQRAIEDFLKNRNKTSVNPTIQFLGNQGQLSFPSTQSSHGSAGFTFSLSGNHDIEGPQGGFECIHQTSTKNLESLGALPCKMRIQANDDVYETTRHRMAVAEETSKNKCTRVIKANGPDIGRKVKVKAQGRTIPPPVNRHREPPSIPSNNSQLSRLPSSSSSSHQSNSSTSTPLSALLMSNSYKPISSNPPVRSQPDKKISELVRRPLKERLIHVLALRPYKKPELYDRITREGIKDRDRSTMTTILKQVAFMRDNTYHLHRHVWNDVQEDWPFYTEQDRAMLKRRKPQNLTPPGSSDGGSSGSGQSPNSTHPGSPPAITAPPASLMSTKRPGYYQGNDGLQTKRPRISHYRKPEPTIISTSNSNAASNHSSCRENSRTTGVNGSSDNVSKNDWENSSSRGQQHRNDFRADRTGSDVISRSYGTNKPCLTPTSDSEDNHSRDNNQHSSVTMTTEENKIYKSDDLRSSIDVRSTTVGYGDSPNGLNDRNNRHDRNDRTDRNDRNDRKERDGPNNEREHSERDNTNSYNEFPSLGSSTYPGNSANSVTASLIPSSPTIQSNKGSEYPDYLTQYMAISSTEQRRRYKAEFNADYEEYRKLHTQVAKVSRRFAQLEERRQRELENGNYEKSEVLKQQIVTEYMNTKRDPAHIETKKRFHYLHEKLSHIKRLVLEYDTQTFSSGLTTSSNTTNNDDDMIDGGSLRY